MKAIVWTKYGSPDVLQLQEVPKPIPKDNEILVKIQATTVTAGDTELRRLQLPLMLSSPMRLYTGLLKPKRITILGQELAGEVEAVGENVTLYKEGDAIFGTTGFRFGTYAEYICLPATPTEMQGTIAPKPTNMTYQEAAAVPVAGFEALHFMQAANVQPGQKVLVFGAGGSIGTFSVQLAKHFGAEVTGVDSTSKMEMLLSIGADHTVDYTQEDFTKNGETYDVMIDVVGKQGLSKRVRSLKPDGYYFLANASPSHLLTRMRSRKKVVIEASSQKKEDLITLKELIEAGKLKTVIGRTYPLAEMAEAHRFAESGQKKGNLVISVAGTN